MHHARFEQAFEELTAYAALLPTDQLWKKSITSMASCPDPGDRTELILWLRDGLRTLTTNSAMIPNGKADDGGLRS